MRKTYQIPSVEMVLLKPCSIICVSPGNLPNSGEGTDQIGDPIVIGG